jgi:hydroxymethylpyrimidine/phosphomethylpyrimidine kinase
MPFAPPLVLSFAAADPTGGAGLQADVLTLAALGCHPLSVLTALTVQDTHGVTRMQALDPRLVAEQALRLLGELRIAAFKIGVVASAANAAAIAAILAEHPRVPVVLDPVLASGRGDSLADAGVPGALREHLLPRTTVLTPNTLEARALGGIAECIARGCKFVLLTGTHADTAEVVNTLHDANGVVREDRWPRLPASYHGSGCTLASAIAARLALGDAVPEAARAAQEFTWRALERGFKPGSGQHLPWR